MCIGGKVISDCGSEKGEGRYRGGNALRLDRNTRMLLMTHCHNTRIAWLL